jgi:hypothetical protein
MAEKRMFSLKIVDSDAFLDLPLSTQALYFHLGMRADDEGFINSPKRIMRQIGASEKDLKRLIEKRYLLSFSSGIVVIKHWKINNNLRKDRRTPTLYVEEKSLIYEKPDGAYTDHPLENNADTLRKQNGIPNDNQMTTESPASGDVDKDSIGKNIPPIIPQGDGRKKKSPEFDHESKPYKCAVFLDREICSRLPAKKPAPENILQSWADAFDKLNRIDGYRWSLIGEALEFSQSDEFWQKNILSGATFRKQFIKIYAKMGGEKND